MSFLILRSYPHLNMPDFNKGPLLLTADNLSVYICRYDLNGFPTICGAQTHWHRIQGTER